MRDKDYAKILAIIMLCFLAWIIGTSLLNDYHDYSFVFDEEKNNNVTDNNVLNYCRNRRVFIFDRNNVSFINDYLYLDKIDYNGWITIKKFDGFIVNKNSIHFLCSSNWYATTIVNGEHQYLYMLFVSYVFSFVLLLVLIMYLLNWSHIEVIEIGIGIGIDAIEAKKNRISCFLICIIFLTLCTYCITPIVIQFELLNMKYDCEEGWYINYPYKGKGLCEAISSWTIKYIVTIFLSIVYMCFSLVIVMITMLNVEFVIQINTDSDIYDSIS